MSTREKAYRIFQTLTEKQLEGFILMFQGSLEEETFEDERETERKLDELRNDPAENAKLPFALRELSNNELDDALMKGLDDIKEGRVYTEEEVDKILSDRYGV